VFFEMDVRFFKKKPDKDYRVMRIFEEVEKVFLIIGGADVSGNRQKRFLWSCCW
jgi:hypothetical protein